jgi:hypothetical protein
MASNFPKDRFDDLPHTLDRVGAHRAPARKGRGWIAFWWALAATLVLIGLGVFGLFVLNNRLNFELPGASTETPVPSQGTPSPTATTTPTPTESATPEPTVDPSLSITVLNGTPGTGVAGGVGELLTEAGWTVDTTSDADSEDVPDTIVYYADPSLEGAARGIAETVEGSEILLSDDFAGSGADITVVVGNDYEPPAG